MACTYLVVTLYNDPAVRRGTLEHWVGTTLSAYSSARQGRYVLR